MVVTGTGTMSATGDTQRLEVGDLVLIPPATDHACANDGDAALVLVSVQSPAVSADELYSPRLATQAAGYATAGFVASSPPTARPSPVTTFSAPLGRPASVSTLAN